MFDWWSQIFHKGDYLYPLARCCGGNRQDGATESAGPILGNIPKYLEFIAWRYACGGGEGILEQNLFIIYRSVEYIALLRVLAILHMTIMLPLRWLAGNCENLAEYKFGVADMPWCVDLMDKAFAKIQRNGKKIMDDDFMFGIFDPIVKKVTPFGEYLEYMFEHKKSSPIGSFKNEEKVTPWDLLRCDLMFPTRSDIVQSNLMTSEIGVHAAFVFREEFRDDSKATAKYLSAIRGAKSMKKVSAKERRAGLSMAASNSVSESLHGASTDLLQVFGTISIPNAAAIGQSRTNNDHGRAHKKMVTGRQPKTAIESRKGAYSEGMATLLCPKLRQSLTVASKEKAAEHKKEQERWMKFQFETRQRKEQMKVEDVAEKDGEGNVVALYFHEQANSPRLWKTVVDARREWARVRSCRMDVVKDQILILLFGLGIEEAHHPWSKDGHTYSADELFEHLATVAIPRYVELKRAGKLPTEAPMTLPRAPNTVTLGTMSELGNNLYEQTEADRARLRMEAQEERDRRERRGEGDIYSEMQMVNAPEIDRMLVKKKFRIEMRFSSPGDGGSEEFDWYSGTVIRLVNKTKRTVEIKWDNLCLHHDDASTTTNVLLISRWNQKIPEAGTWREYLTKK